MKYEYLKIDLNPVSSKRADIDLINDAARDGWRLVWVTPNSFAYLEREIEEEPAPRPKRAYTRRTDRTPPTTGGTP